MPEPSTAPDQVLAPDPDRRRLDALRERLAELVLASPGVHRLVPNLTASLRRLTGRDGRTSSADGVELTLRGHRLDVAITLATSSDHPARTTCEHVLGAVHTAVTAAGITPGSIDIDVLTIEPGPRPAASDPPVPGTAR